MSFISHHHQLYGVYKQFLLAKLNLTDKIQHIIEDIC